MVDLTVEIAPGLILKNPVLTASGTFGYGREYAPYFDIAKLGGIITKGLSLEPKTGNPGIRITETACGMLNAIGLENIGIEQFLSMELPLLRKLGAVVIVNIFGQEQADYAALAARLDGVEGISALEINISCPNVKAGGIQFGTDPAAAAKLVAAVRQATSLPLITKLSPNVSDIVAIAQAVVEAGSDALSLINTLMGMAIDLDRKKPILGNTTGGLSGPAIKPVALRMVYQVASAVSVPVIGIGGIVNQRDALEFLLAGATAVEIGTASFINPQSAALIVAGIENYLDRQGCKRVVDFIGSLEKNPA
ncbi:MAG: dihydroorotate dehydrogenase [Deltaproteobacteria bacterium]|nr:dihydroorotate dehydrogenase [Deltaproteobacteria bacterium]